MVGSSSSSLLSSSSDDRWEFHELVRVVDEVRQQYSDATYEVGRLELCLEAVGVALTASEMETIDAHGRIMGKGFL